ncbi:MAG: hypothetical protein FWC71_05485 [Defluviitaleaceae bacterium]|nr:hypothetical protein [Defluviitaleaceae bacterium]
MHITIEKAINDHLKGEAQENAQDFIAYLQANGVAFHESDNGFWHPTYKGKNLFTLNVEVSDNGDASFDALINDLPSTWEDESVSINERTKEIIWKNVRPCEITDCGDCSPGITKNIFGKVFNNLCGSFLGIYNPDAETYNCLKQLFDGLKDDIDKKCIRKLN